MKKIILRKQTRNLPLRNRQLLLETLHDGARQAGLIADTDTGYNTSPVYHVILIGPRKMRQLNKQYLGHDWVTDVLAFDLREPDPSGESTREGVAAGEIYVCPEVAQDRCTEYNTSVGYELILYVVHGMLHLAGEQDKSALQQRRMRKRETEIMKQLQERFDLDAIFK